MPAINPVITSAGLSAAIAADSLGLQLHITHVAMGAGAFNPVSGTTALVDRRETVTVASGSRSGALQITIQALFLAASYSGAAYNVGEIGLYAGDPASGGTLFAVASQVGANFGPRGGVGVNFEATFDFALSGVPSGSVTVTVDPAASVAHALIATHSAAADPHPVYLKKSGGTMTGAITLAANAVNPMEPTL